MVVAALMMAGFLYIAVNFGRNNRYGYGYDEYEEDYSDSYYYNKRSTRRRDQGEYSTFNQSVIG